MTTVYVNALVDVLAPDLGVGLGSYTLYEHVAFTVMPPPVTVVVGQRGQTLADLNLDPPNVAVSTTYEVLIHAALGFPSVTIPAKSCDINRRRYEVTRPIFQYSPTGTLPIAHDTGVYLSADLGASWSYLALPDYPTATEMGVPTFVERGGTTSLFFASASGRIARYDLTTRQMVIATFTGAESDLARTKTAYGLAGDPDSDVVLYAGGSGSGIWRSTDNGLTFALSNRGQSAGLAGLAVAWHPTEAGLCYAASGVLTGNVTLLYKSTDSGVSWTLACTLDGAEEGNAINLALGLDPDVVYMRTQFSVVKSSDQGATFSPIHSGLPTDFELVDPLRNFRPGQHIVVAPSDADILYAAVNITGTAAYILKSTNAGGSWSTVLTIPQLPGPFQGWPTGGLSVHPTDPDIVAYTSLGMESTAGVVISDDGGTTWALAEKPQGIVDPAVMLGSAFTGTTRMAATGRHRASGDGKMLQTGTETTYEELHEVTLQLPFAAAVVQAIKDRTTTGPPTVFPLVQVSAVTTHRNGVRVKENLATIRLTQLDVKQTADARQITLFGTEKRPVTARAPRDTQLIPQSEIEGMDETPLDYSATLPGIRTDWQLYDKIEANGLSGRVSAIRYALTTERRSTVLTTGALDTAVIDPDVNEVNKHPRVIIGRRPSPRRPSRWPNHRVIPQPPRP